MAITTKPIRNLVFKDLDLNFGIHPNNKKLNILKDDLAILRSLKNLIMTDFYERPFHPEIGCNLRSMLFDNILPSTAKSIKNTIIETVNNFEPRIQLNDVTVIVSPENNGYNVLLEYFIINSSTSKRSSFFLERIR